MIPLFLHIVQIKELLKLLILHRMHLKDCRAYSLAECIHEVSLTILGLAPLIKRVRIVLVEGRDRLLTHFSRLELLGCEEGRHVLVIG